MLENRFRSFPNHDERKARAKTSSWTAHSSIFMALDAFRRALGRLLDALGRLLAALGRLPDASRTPLGRSWAQLEHSWAPFGCILAPREDPRHFGRVLEPPEAGSSSLQGTHFKTSLACNR